MNSPVRLPVDLEYTNISDVHASLVWIPELSSFPVDAHDVVTDTKRKLKLTDVAGLPIGHSPRGLSFAFRQLLEIDCSIHAIALADPCPSFPPWPLVKEKGGGIVILCDYIITCSADRVDYVKGIISKAISNMPEKDAMAMEVVYL
jgi:hypothetical protein